MTTDRSTIRYERLEHLLKLCMDMQGSAAGISLQDIEREFGVGRRTAERMRDAVRNSFPQIEEIGEPGGRKYWRLPKGTMGRLIDPTLPELAALQHASALAKRDGDEDTARHLDLLAAKVRASLGASRMRKIAPDLEALLEADGVTFRPGPREQTDERIVQQIQEAILCGCMIEADHRARNTGRLSRGTRLGPIALLQGETRRYLLAWSEYQEDLRLFTLSGFERVSLEDESFERPEGFDLSTWLSESFGVFREPAQDIVWRFSPKVADEVASWVFHPGQTTERTADGALIVRFRAGGMLEMVWHLFRWGDQVEVIAPEALRELFLERLAQAALGLKRGEQRAKE